MFIPKPYNSDTSTNDRNSDRLTPVHVVPPHSRAVKIVKVAKFNFNEGRFLSKRNGI